MTKTEVINRSKNYALIGASAAATAVTFLAVRGMAQAQAPGAGGSDPVTQGVDAARPSGRAGEVGLFEEGGIFQTVVNTLLFVVGAISVVMLIIGGIRYVISGGDSNAVNGAKNTILYAIVGLVIAFLAFAAVNFVIGQLEN